MEYVGRGAFKLEKALDEFGVSPRGKICLDSGLSTGGFAQVLLRRGARRVYGVEIGRNQVANEIASDRRMIVMEQTDLREVMIPEPIELATLDLSFVSLTEFAEKMRELLTDGGELIMLVKPQFELPRSELDEAGAATKEEQLEKATRIVRTRFEDEGFRFEGFIRSPIEGKSAGSIEGLIYLRL